MFAFCGSYRRCYLKFHVAVSSPRSSLTSHSGQHAYLSQRAVDARVDWGTTRGGWQAEDPSEEQPNAPVNDSKTGRASNELFSKQTDDDISSPFPTNELEARRCKNPDSTYQLATNALTTFIGSQAHRDEEYPSKRNMPGSSLGLRNTGKVVEANSGKSRNEKGTAFQQIGGLSWSSSKFPQTIRHGSLDLEDSSLIESSSIEQVRSGQGTRTDENRHQNSSDTQEERDDDMPAASSKQPPTDSVTSQLQIMHSASSHVEATHQARTLETASSGTSKEEENCLQKAEELPGTDTLYTRLRIPNRTNYPKVSRGRSAGHPISEMKKAKGKPERLFHRVVRLLSVERIEEKLNDTAHRKPHVNGVQFMLKELIEVRHVKPQAHHYQALILSHCEAYHGAADALYPILAEMERENVMISTSILSAVLKVLSIHPDAQLLVNVQQALSNQWAPESSEVTTYLILALCRANQLELALTHLERLITTSTSPRPDNVLEIPIPQYLYTTILYRLASPAIGDHTAVLHLLYLLGDHNLPISNVCISYLLDSAAEALHLDLTLYLWRSHVDTHYIVPSTGLCRNALLTAARNGDAQLAWKVSAVLESRGNRAGWENLQMEELEMIREAFMADKGSKVNLGWIGTIMRRIVNLRKLEAWGPNRGSRRQRQFERGLLEGMGKDQSGRHDEQPATAHEDMDKERFWAAVDSYEDKG